MSTKPYKILQNQLLGRYMVANKNLKQGELILKELPVVIGPQLNGPACCFACFKKIDSLNCAFCTQCDTALLCNNDCKGLFHSDDECITLRTQKIKGQILAENPAVIFPLRCLLLNIYNPDIFEKLKGREAHLELRRDTSIWRRHKLAVENVLKEMNFLSKNDLEEEIVQKVCGILDVNTFEIRPPKSKIIKIMNPEIQCLRGLYLNAAMMAHNCVANAHLSVDDNFLMSIYASTDIDEDEPILFNYSNVLQGTKERQEHLLEGKYFSCNCKRCEDPTELGTEISSLICHKGRKGFLRFTEIEKGFKIWKCAECKVCFKDVLINLAIEEARRQISDLDPTNMQEMERLLRKLMMTFHTNHYLLLELKQNMVGLYTKLSPTKNNLNKKIDLCGRLLSVFTKVEPGISRIRALTMYELQASLVDLSNKQYRDKEIDDERLLSELKTAENILKEATKFLLYEPKKSPEGEIAQMALNELKMLRLSIKNIQHDLLLGNTTKGRTTYEKLNEVSKRLKDKIEKTEESRKNVESEQLGKINESESVDKNLGNEEDLNDQRKEKTVQNGSIDKKVKQNKQRNAENNEANNEKSNDQKLGDKSTDSNNRNKKNSQKNKAKEEDAKTEISNKKKKNKKTK